MPTSAALRCPLTPRGAAASLLAAGLAVGLAATSAGAVPVVTPTTVSTSSSTEVDATAFVQEGAARSTGGQVVAWGDHVGSVDGIVPPALPEGVYAVGLVAGEMQLLVLRSDGGVDRYENGVSSGSTQHLPAPSDDLRYTAAASTYNGSARLLRSDGVITDSSGDVVLTPPDGLAYTAIAEGLALRTDGVLEPSGHPGVKCSDARDPGAGLRYTAISRRAGAEDWAALRDDGAMVWCQGGEDATATVVEPPDGSSFIGVDMGQAEAVAVTTHGRVISSESGLLTRAPEGRSIVSLAAMGRGQGAATLDDGTLLSWGLSGQEATPPVVPEGRDKFSAVSGHHGYGTHWSIMVGDPIPVDVDVVQVQLPSDRPLRVTDPIRMALSAGLREGPPTSGRVDVEIHAPGGSTTTLDPIGADRGEAQLVLGPRDHERAGHYAVDATFSAAPYATTTVRTTFDLKTPSPVTVSTSGPTIWHQGSEDTLCVDLDTEDGSRLWYPSYDQAILRSALNSRTELFTRHEGSQARGCVRHLDLPLGTHTLTLDYDSWGDVDAASWTGQVEVLPPATTLIDTDLPASWKYGQQPDAIWATVTSDMSTPVGSARLEVADRQLGMGAQLDPAGRARLWLGGEQELEPGTHTVTATYLGGNGFLPATRDHTVTVEAAEFTSSSASVHGTPVVGRVLSADTDGWSPAPTGFRYEWLVDGDTVDGATSSTFAVPASAVGRSISVKVTGLTDHHRTSVTSAPTDIVAKGKFSADRPAIKGTKRVGKTLRVDLGTWTPEPTSTKYIWRANGAKIAVRTSPHLTVPAKARGKRLTVTVVGTRDGYTKKGITSAPTDIVAKGKFSADRPAIKGTKRVGKTLRVDLGTWTPEPTSTKYIWRANGAKIAVRTSPHLTVPAKARGKRLTVTVVGTRDGYTKKGITSAPTVKVRTRR